MRAPAIGDLVVYKKATDFGVARVSLLRERHVTAFPWRQADRRWDKRQFRVDRRDVLKVLPKGVDPAQIADNFNVLGNRFRAERAAARQAFEARVQSLITGLDGEGA